MPGNRPFANAAFFPAAMLYSALILPWSVLALIGVLPGPPGLLSVGGHAHEMLFGYALAVVAGYLLGPQSVPWLAGLCGCWVAARVSFLVAPDTWPAFVIGGLFAGLVAAKVMPRFLKSAKKWRNKTVAPVVGAVALCTPAGAWLVGSAPGPARMILYEVVLLLTVLLFFMGGRIIAPAMAGYIVKGGGSMPHRVQPKVEGTVLVLLGAALVLSPWRASWSSVLAGAALLGAGLLTAWRWFRWRPWRCRGRPDLIALVSGYAWLWLGLILLGIAEWTPLMPRTLAIHAITAGALGTLTFTVMVRTRLLYRFRDPNRFPVAHQAVLLIHLATLARMAYAIDGTGSAWLIAAAVMWSLAFFTGLAVVGQSLRPRPHH